MGVQDTGLRVAISLALVALAASALAQSKKAAQTNSEMIASAMAAAPKTVAEGATIVAVSEDGSMKTLRKGTNGFTCMPDNPVTPGPDPMCLDSNAMEWAHAWMTHASPPDKVGFVYMLAGGYDASNTDPYAKGPAPHNHWIATGAHVMVGARP